MTNKFFQTKSNNEERYLLVAENFAVNPIFSTSLLTSSKRTSPMLTCGVTTHKSILRKSPT
jgi:hypothetical protein